VVHQNKELLLGLNGKDSACWLKGGVSFDQKKLWGPESNLNRIDAPYTGYHHHSFHGLWDPEIK
jgi:hypothetical protein